MINKKLHCFLFYIFTDPIKKVPDPIPEVTDPVQHNSWLWGNHNTTNTLANQISPQLTFDPHRYERTTYKQHRL